MAEIIESGYSTNTLADFMEIGAKKDGKYREEGDPEVWDEINGIVDIPISHAAGLARYYGAEIDYLFSKELHVMSGKPVAYWKWFDENRKKAAEIRKAEEMRTIEYSLHSRPELFEFVKLAMSLNDEHVRLMIGTLEELVKK